MRGERLQVPGEVSPLKTKGSPPICAHRELHAPHQSTIVDSALSSALSPQNECLVEIAPAFLTRQMGLIAL